MKLEKVIPLFSEPLSMFTLKSDNLEVIKELKKLKFIPRSSDYTHAHDRNNYGSESFDVFNKGPNLKCLEAGIHSACQTHIKEVLEYKADFQITNAWATKVEPKGYAARHYHSNHWLSGVYYPVGDPDFKIRIHASHKPTWHAEIEHYNVFNSMSWTCTAKDNLLIIFNSLLDHEILENTSKHTRYSIAFNLLPKGTIGKGDAQITL